MKNKELSISALLLAFGLLLHFLVPPVFGGVKPDFLLATIIIGLIINNKFNNALILAFGGGILAAMTTGFIGGQLPNIIDKLIATLFAYLLIKLLAKLNFTKVSIIAFLTTLVSGSIFLCSALLLVGLPLSFKALFIAVVLPTSIANIFVTTILYKALNYVK